MLAFYGLKHKAVIECEEGVEDPCLKDIVEPTPYAMGAGRAAAVIPAHRREYQSGLEGLEWALVLCCSLLWSYHPTASSQGVTQYFRASALLSSSRLQWSGTVVTWPSGQVTL